MMIRTNRFNIYLLLLLAFGLACGCSTPEEKEAKNALSTLRIFLEVNPDYPGLSENADFQGVQMNIQKEPILNETDIREVTLIQANDDYCLTLRLEDRGTLLFEQYTAGNPKKHLVVFSQWVEAGQKKVNAGQFLAAPKITGRIVNGMFTFTPACTHDEAERIVKGLNNAIKKRHSRESF
jgi:hypothetical protein